jgi:hypothetical protein
MVCSADSKQAGKQAFCAGMDLKQRLDIIKTNEVALDYPQGGFAGMTNRVGKKPIIVACNGHAHGGPSLSSSFSHQTNLIIRRRLRNRSQCRRDFCFPKRHFLSTRSASRCLCPCWRATTCYATFRKPSHYGSDPYWSAPFS